MLSPFDPSWANAGDFAERVRAATQGKRARGDRRAFEIFDALLMQEAFPCTPAEVAGPLEWKQARRPVVRLDRPRLTPLPDWVESDVLTFKRCDAEGILVVEKGGSAPGLHRACRALRMNLLVVATQGIPGARTRRFVHRLHVEFKLPVYVLTDNDTWGYFLYSVLKRGMIAPAGVCPPLAAPRARYLGIRTGEAAAWLPARVLVPSAPSWKARLRGLRRHACFGTPAWQAELVAFVGQRGGCDLEAFTGILGARRFAEAYIKPKLLARGGLR